MKDPRAVYTAQQLATLKGHVVVGATIESYGGIDYPVMILKNVVRQTQVYVYIQSDAEGNDTGAVALMEFETSDDPLKQA